MADTTDLNAGKPFFCLICDVERGSLAAMDSHIRHIHGDDPVQGETYESQGDRDGGTKREREHRERVNHFEATMFEAEMVVVFTVEDFLKLCGG